MSELFDQTLEEYGLTEAITRPAYARRLLQAGEVSNLTEGGEVYNSLPLEDKIDFLRRYGKERREALRLAEEQERDSE